MAATALITLDLGDHPRVGKRREVVRDARRLGSGSIRINPGHSLDDLAVHVLHRDEGCGHHGANPDEDRYQDQGLPPGHEHPRTNNQTPFWSSASQRGGAVFVMRIS